MSCVIYHCDTDELSCTLESMNVAAAKLRQSKPGDMTLVLYLIDNSDTPVDMPDVASLMSNWRVIERAGHGNIGYGGGHNIAIDAVESAYHLIVNPDVIFDEFCLLNAIQYMDANPDVVLLTPESTAPKTGVVQFQCKRYPSLLVLMLRLLNNRLTNRLFHSVLAQYEERENILAGKVFDANIVSGCFMLFRTPVLKRMNGFDERFFLYFEDYDLSIRAGEYGAVKYNPNVKIMHYGGGAGRKGWLHIRLFVRSAISFFNKHGWKWV